MKPEHSKILLVDDIQDNLTSLKATIECAFPGIEIHTALNGPRGIELARELLPDVILLDILMPGMDGFEVCAELKADEQLRDSPVVFLTARQTDRESRIKALEVGAEAFLAKPVDEAELFAQIRAMLKIKAALDARRLEQQRLSAMVEVRTQALNHELKERHRALLALRESEERHRTLVENVPAIIYRFSTSRGGLFYSPRIEGVLGRPRQDFLDNPGLWHELVHPEDRAMVMGALSFDHGSGEAGFELEYRIRGGSGEWVWLHDRSISLKVDNGETIIEGIAQDVTARKNAENERRILERQLQQTQKLESLGVLAGGIAHDFNNVLSIIRSNCFLGKDENCGNAAIDAYFENIESEVARAARLCQKMLTYAGKNPLAPSKVNLGTMLEDNLNLFRAAVSKHIVLEYDSGADGLDIVCDQAQIQQAVLNLVINAADAIGENSGVIRIALAHAVLRGEPQEYDFRGKRIPAGQYVCLTVTDDGRGMNAEVRRKLFEPFFTTKFPGRGLGLPAVLGIVNNHEGALQVASEEGAGTCVKIWLPRDHVSPDCQPASSGRGLPEQQESKVVLVVEDEDALRNLSSKLLGKMGFSTICAMDGLDALDIFNARKTEIDLILLDMIMPNMNGAEVYQAIREQSRTIPILFCSGFCEDDSEISINEDRFAGYIQKPIAADQLRHTMMRLLKAA